MLFLLALKWKLQQKAFSNVKAKTSSSFAVKVTERSNHLFLLSIWWITFLRHLYDHSHKKRKDSQKTRTAFRWILILTWNFGGGRSDSASAFFKIASASWFWYHKNYNRLFYMLDNDNVISASVSEAVEKIPTDEKDYRKCSLCFTLHSRSSGKEQINL